MKIKQHILDLIKNIAAMNHNEISDILLDTLGIDITNIDIIEFLASEGITVTYQQGQDDYNNIPETELRTIIKSIQDGNDDNREILFNYFNKRLINHAVRHSASDYDKWEDRYHRNVEVLYNAAKTFDLNRKEYFASYLTACLNNEQNTFTRQDRAIPIKQNIYQAYLKICKAINVLDIDKDWDEMTLADFEEISKMITALYPKTKMSPSRIRSLMEDAKTKSLVLSLDEPADEGNDDEYDKYDKVQLYQVGHYGEEQPTMEDMIIDKEAMQIINDAFKDFKQEEVMAFLYVHKFGFTAVKTSEIMGIHRVTVASYADRVMSACRDALKKRGLFSYD